MKVFQIFILIVLFISMTYVAGAQVRAEEPMAFSKGPDGKFPRTGTIERIDPALDMIIAPGAQVEKLAEGFVWSEGPVWAVSIGSVLFSDVPRNSIYSWNESDGLKLWLKPSGYSGEGYYSREPGSNGLLLDRKGRLVLCQHGNRQIARMATPIANPSPQFKVLASRYNGKKLNSPNDAAFDGNGNLFFTDPPYGLPKQMQDSTKETSWQGVYKVKKNGRLYLLLDSITRPNGIAFFPGHKSLLLANSDPGKAIWYRYEVNGNALMNGSVFFDATTNDSRMPGLPDGLKIDSKGNVFASGPGGIYIFNSSGKKLGLIRLEQAASNVALSPDEKTLYITNHQYLLRIKMR